MFLTSWDSGACRGLDVRGLSSISALKASDFLHFAPPFFISKTANQGSLHAFRQMHCIPVWLAQGERVWDQLAMPAVGAKGGSGGMYAIHPFIIHWTLVECQLCDRHRRQNRKQCRRELCPLEILLWWWRQRAVCEGRSFVCLDHCWVLSI